MKILVSKNAAIISFIVALPVMIFGTDCWIHAIKGSIYSDISDNLSDIIFYVLGFPLSTLVYDLFLNISGGRLNRTTEILALPFLNIALLLQWLIWSQPIAFLWRKKETIEEKSANFISNMLTGRGKRLP